MGKAITRRERFGSLPIEVLRVATLASCMLLTQSALGQYIAPLDLIAQTFGVSGDAGQESWGAAAYSLTVGTFVLPAGRAGDIVGHKRVVCFGMAWFALWSLICGLSSYSGSVIFFDFSRAMQGIGPAIILPNGVAILARIYAGTKWRRLVVFSIFAATAPNGFLLGAVFSGLLAKFTPAGWPWAFYVMAITLVVDLALFAYSVPSDKQMDSFEHLETVDEPSVDSEALPKRKPKFDWWGTLFGMSGLILLNFVWSQAPLVGWDTVYIYVLLIVSIGLLAIFFFVEVQVADPLIPSTVWNVQSSLILGCVGAGWSSFGILVFYWWRLMTVLNEQPILLTVAQNTPAGISGIVAASVSVYTLQRAGPAWVMLGSMLAFLVSLILLATMPVGQIYWAQSFVIWCIAPFGMDMSFPAATIIVSNALPYDQQGLGGTLVNTIINYSIALGLGFAGTVEVYTGGGDVLKGYRGAMYMGVGLSGLGVILALINKVVEQIHQRRQKARTN